MKKLSWILVLVNLCVVGCASLDGKIENSKLQKKDRIYFLKLSFEGSAFQPKVCEIYVNGDFTPSARYSGQPLLAFVSDGSKTIRVSEIACLNNQNRYETAWHLRKVEFEKKPVSLLQSEATYLGDFGVKWKLADFNESARGPRNKIVVGGESRIYESGEFEVKRTDDFEGAVQELKNSGKVQSDTLTFRNILAE